MEQMGFGVPIIVKSYGKKSYYISEKTIIVSKHFEKDVNETIMGKVLNDHKTTQKILEMIELNPKITTIELAQQLNLTREGINYQIRKLKKEFFIKRVGSNMVIGRLLNRLTNSV